MHIDAPETNIEQSQEQQTHVQESRFLKLDATSNANSLVKPLYSIFS